MNVIEFFAQFLAMFLIKNFRRRTIFIIYTVLMTSLNVLMGLSSMANMSTASMIIFLMIIFTWECLGQPNNTLYAVEITMNAAMGVLAMFTGFLMFGAGIGIRVMVNYLSVPLLFFISASVTGLYMIFAIFCLKETSHLTDKEKKSVYSLNH